MQYHGEEFFIIDQFDDYDLLYVPLRGYLAKILKGSDIIEDEEFMNHFLEFLGGREYFDFDAAVERVRNTLPALSIPITDDCNLRCVYCYASAGDHGHVSTFTKSMVDSVLDAYFDFIERRGDEYVKCDDKVVPITLAGGGSLQPNLNCSNTQ